MEEMIKKYTIRSIIISLALIALAIILIFNPIKLLNTIMIILGVVVIADGIWHIISYFNEPAEFKAFSFELLEGIAEIVLGFIFIFNPSWVISIIYLLIGIWIIFESIIKVQMSLNLKDIIENWKLMIVVSVISILFGIFIIAHPFITTAILSVICGVALLIAEIINLIESIYICVKMKD
jgi:uncharacterized membrane protein HdeD (DUF308 family)